MRKAFTLIEILVVIAIIGILTAISFPVFGRARENARRSSCLSNVRQISLGILQYAGDYDEFLPPVAYSDAAGEDVVWPQMVAPYLKSEQIFKCPSDSKSQRYSYGLNELAFVDLQDDAATPPINLARFGTVSETVMLGDVGLNEAGEADTLKMVEPADDLDDDFDARPLDRHLERSSIAWMDGHVKAMRFDQFYLNQSPANRYFQP